MAGNQPDGTVEEHAGRMGRRGVLMSTAVVSAGTAVSRVLGLVREILMAVAFGTSLTKSAFDVAFKVPNLFRRLFGEGALSAAFVPVFSDVLEQKGLEEANRFVSRIMTMLATALCVICAAGILTVTAVLHYAELGERAAAVLPLLRIMLPYAFFICLVAVCMGILNSFHRFAVPAFTPVLLNVVWILAVIFACPRMGVRLEDRIVAVALGILAAGALQLAVQLPFLYRLGLRPTVSFSWKDPAVSKVLLLMGPAALGMGVHQVNVVVDGLLALWAGPWAPAALTYAERMIYLPLGVFATALGTVLLPTFSRHAARNEDEHIRTRLGDALRDITLVMMPAAAGLIALAGPIIQVTFEWKGGRFSGDSTLLTARALAFYAPGLVVFSVYKVLVPVFYAMKDTMTPVRIGLRVVLLNFLLNVAFVLSWPAMFKHAGLAFATVISSGVNCVALGTILHRKVGNPGWMRFAVVLAKALAVSAVMGIASRLSYGALATALLPWLGDGKGTALAALAGGIAVGIAVYAVLAMLLFRSELRELRSRGRRA